MTLLLAAGGQAGQTNNHLFFQSTTHRARSTFIIFRRNRGAGGAGVCLLLFIPWLPHTSALPGGLVVWVFNFFPVFDIFLIP